MKVAVIGGGVIGGGWAARFVLNGHDVEVYDPAPHAERKVMAMMENARASLPALYDNRLPPAGRLRFVSSIEAAVEGSDWVQESVPERMQLKQKTYGMIAGHLGSAAILASSTSSFLPSALQERFPKPEQLIVAHPFNPVYLLPLVEIVGSEVTPAAVKEQAAGVMRGIGMHPLVLRREIMGFIGNRLQEAVWRETLWMVKDGIATTQEIDEAIVHGFGLRWAQMGQFETYRLGGGEAGIRHFIAQFGPSLAEPLTHLMDVPDLDDTLVSTIAKQSDDQSGTKTITELERLRDTNLVNIIRALRATGSASGHIAADHDVVLKKQQSK